MVLAGTVARYNVSVASAATSGVTSCTYAAATANPAIPQKFMGSLKASFRYFRSNLGSSAITTYTCKALIVLNRSTSAVRVATRRFAFSRKCLRRRRTSSRAQQTHVALVREKFVLQLHVHRLALDVLHLRIDVGRAQLHLRFGCCGTTIDLVAHLVEGRCIVAKLKRLHRLRKLFLKFGLLRLVYQLHRLGGAALHLKHVIVACFKCLFRCQVRVLQLLCGLDQVDLHLLQLSNVCGRDVVATHFH